MGIRKMHKVFQPRSPKRAKVSNPDLHEHHLAWWRLGWHLGRCPVSAEGPCGAPAAGPGNTFRVARLYTVLFSC